MNSSWDRVAGDQVAGQLRCHWSEVGERTVYNPPWMQQAADFNPKPTMPACLDFKRLSPFGGRRWFDPTRGYAKCD